MLDLQRKAFRRHHHSIILLVLAVISYAFFFHGLGNIGFLGPDEPRYSSIAREMLRSGDFVTPRLNGVPWFEKPALLYWGAAIGDAIFGVSEFGARFPSAFAATVGVYFVYFCARRLWGQTTGLMTALVMASSTGFLTYARAVSMDMLLTVCLTMALCSFLLGSSAEGSIRKRWFYVFYACLGFGALAKGPIAFVLPGIALFGYLLFRRSLSEWKEWHPRAAWIAVAIAAPWYVACTWANGAVFPQEFFLNHNLQRFTTNLYGHPRPFYFYLPVLLMLTFPWTFILISALRRRFDRTDALLLWWIATPIVFFSFSGSKLPGYILPVIPPIAMLCARELQRDTSRLFRIGVFIEAGAMIFIGVAFGFFGGTLNVDPHVDGILIATASFIFAGLLIVIGLWLTPRFLAAFNMTAIAFLVLFGVNLILPRFDLSDTMRPWSIALADRVPAEQVVYIYKPQRWAEYGLQYYRSGKADSINSPEQFLSIAAVQPEVLCIADNKTVDEIAHIANLEMKTVMLLGNQTAFKAWRAK